MTNITIDELKDLIRLFSEKYGPQLGDGLTGASFLWGKSVKKVYGAMIPKEEVFKEAYLMACVERAGIKTSRPLGVYQEMGYWVLEMTYVAGQQFLGVVNDAFLNGKEREGEEMIARMAREQAAINGRDGAGLPSYKAYAREVILGNSQLTEEQKKRLTVRLDSLPEGRKICHGDLHPNNFLIDEKGELTAIDWPEVGLGVPACDGARTYLNMHHPAFIRKASTPLCEIFLNAYCAATGVAREEIMRWVPIHAGMLIGYKKPDFSEVISKYLL